MSPHEESSRCSSKRYVLLWQQPKNAIASSFEPMHPYTCAVKTLTFMCRQRHAPARPLPTHQ